MSESLFNFIKKETLAQVFSYEFYEISKNTCSYRTPPVAASEEPKTNLNSGTQESPIELLCKDIFTLQNKNEQSGFTSTLITNGSTN